MTTRLAIRVFVAGKLQREERVEFSQEQMESGFLETLAANHASMLDRPHMIEIEFLDEPNANERFFRIGTDPHQMVNPIRIDPARMMD